MSWRDVVLSQFEPDLVPLLIDYGNHLAQIDADAVVFMARKSLCLYDVLVAAGAPPIERPVLTDRVLDADCEPLRGSRVALVDDTLIVGTTLATARRFLVSELGCDVSTHTFCVDTDWWVPELIQPDFVSVRMPDARVMSFCTSEVRALSLAPRPYVVDFPMSYALPLSKGEVGGIPVLLDWSAHDVSSSLQHRNGITTVSFFPGGTVRHDLEALLGEDLMRCLEIVKVRTYIRRGRGKYWLQTVPLVTVSSLSPESVDEALRLVVSVFPDNAQSAAERLRNSVSAPAASQRALQYLVSLVVGQRFFLTLQQAGVCESASFDPRVAQRVFGPWRCSLDDPLHRVEYRSLRQAQLQRRTAAPHPATMPQSIAEYGFESLQGKSNRLPDNLLAFFTQTFTDLFDSREIPARLEARRLKQRVLDADPKEAPHRDRLTTGIPWESLSRHFLELAGIPSSTQQTNLLSSALDVLNDYGIAVPTTCFRNGVVFRAYRHGEDARFADAELALGQQALQGLIGELKVSSAPKIAFEKTLVLLLRIGMAQQYIEPFFGTTGAEGTARIEFAPMGPIAKVTVEPRSYPDRDLWLTDYMLQRRVITKVNERYAPGKRIDANHHRTEAPDFAFELGSILGLLLRSRGKHRVPKRAIPPLDGDKLTILAVCWPPRMLAGAMHAELVYFMKWWRRHGATELEAVDWHSQRSLLGFSDSLARGTGSLALNQGRFKYAAHKSSMHGKLVKQCERFLREELGMELVARRWAGYWRSAEDLMAVEEERRFGPWIDSSAALVWELLAVMSALEISILDAAMELGPRGSRVRARRERALEKLDDHYNHRRRYRLRLSDRGYKLYRRLRSHARQIEQASPDPSRQLSLFSAEGHKHKGEAVLGWCTRYIRDIDARIASLGDEVVPTIGEFGRLPFRRQYKYLVWYDIRNSTATGLPSDQAVDEHRERVRAFKKQINDRLRRVARSITFAQEEIHCWNGDLDSDNDEKHIFLSGRGARRNAQAVLSELLAAQRGTNIHARILVIRCDFVGTLVYRLGLTPEIHGSRFWEHLSRLKLAIKDRESGLPDGIATLAIAGSGLWRALQLPAGFVWRDSQVHEFTTEIEKLTASTEVRFGEISWRP
jgi:hypothetical protein